MPDYYPWFNYEDDCPCKREAKEEGMRNYFIDNSIGFQVKLMKRVK